MYITPRYRPLTQRQKNIASREPASKSRYTEYKSNTGTKTGRQPTNQSLCLAGN